MNGDTGDAIGGSARPRIVNIGVAILGALYAYSLFRTLQAGIEPQYAARILPGFVATPLLLAGAWAGLGAARWVLALFLAVDVIIFVSLAGKYRQSVANAEIAYVFLRILGTVLLFFGAANAWFREWRDRRRRHRWYLAWVITGFVLLIPAVLAILALRPGLNMVGPGNVVFMGAIYVMLIPALIFGRPHFMFGIGAGPATSFGLFLFFAFWFVVLLALAALWWRLTRLPRVKGQPIP